MRTRVDWPLKSGKSVFLTFSLISFIYIVFGMYGHWTYGFLQRFTGDPEKLQFLETYENSAPDWRYFARERILEKYGNECNFFNLESARLGIQTTIPRESISLSCYTRDFNKLHSLLLWGDSHAQMLRYGLVNALPDNWQVLQVASTACRPNIEYDSSLEAYCNYSNNFATKVISETHPDVVILAQVFGHDPIKLKKISNFLKEKGVKKVVITGPTPQWNYDLPWIVLRYFWDSKLDRTSLGLRSDLFSLDDNLKVQLSELAGVTYVSLNDVFCNSQGCLMYLKNNKKNGLVSYDYGHLVPQASLFLAQNALAAAITSTINSNNN